MRKTWRGAFLLALAVTALPCFVGCSEDPNALPAGPPPGNARGPGVAGGPDPASTPLAASSAPSNKQIMTRLTKGPNSLTSVLRAELTESQPPWETIQIQTKEYAELALALGKNEPGRGSKESWTKLTSAYAGSAAELDRAAQAKEKDAALAAHGQLTNSCQACHREHRAMGRGMGGGMMGGPPRGFRTPGGPPGSPPPGEPAPK